MPNIIVSLYKVEDYEATDPIAQFKMEVPQDANLALLSNIFADQCDSLGDGYTEFNAIITNYDTIQTSSPETFVADAESVLRALNHID